MTKSRYRDAVDTVRNEQLPGLVLITKSIVFLSLKSSLRIFAVCYYILVFPWAKRRYHFFVKSLKKGVLELSLRVTLQ